MKLFFPTTHHYACNNLPSLHLFPFPVPKTPGIKPRQWPHISSSAAATTTTICRYRRKEKIIVIMGATGTGKSRLSVDLASTFFPSEIINSDKMQLYNGLDITTNKITYPERCGVPHHLLGSLDSESELSPSEFRSLAHSIILDIASRRKVPIIVGGSNSLIHALVVEDFDPDSDVFDGGDPVSSELRYNCCFLWVDVSFKVLSDYLSKRVDEMLMSGMFEELAEFYDQEEAESGYRIGLRKAIGVPEFDRYFRKYPPEIGTSVEGNDPVRRRGYEKAVREIKENTCELAKRQVGKIVRLEGGGGGWDLRKLDATEAVRVAMMRSEMGKKKRWLEVWDRDVVEPSVKIVNRFLRE